MCTAPVARVGQSQAAILLGAREMTTTQQSTSTASSASEVGRRPRRPGGGMPWPDARTRAGAAALPLTACLLPLQEAGGCLLATDLIALTDLPVTDTSAMDGWAVAGSPPWRVVADLPAGRVLEHRLDDGQCARIATGAVVPDGADAVLQVERSLCDTTGVRPSDPDAALAPRTHIRRAGEEAGRGDVLVPAGTVVTPPVLGLAAAAGYDTLLVT